jgi:hypothetical protein
MSELLIEKCPSATYTRYDKTVGRFVLEMDVYIGLTKAKGVSAYIIKTKKSRPT